jgi:hypothetical protein
MPLLVFSPTEKKRFFSFVKTQTMAEEKKGKAPVGVFTNGRRRMPPLVFSPTEEEECPRWCFY